MVQLAPVTYGTPVPGSWFGNSPGWTDTGDSGLQANGQPVSAGPGIALGSRSTLGQWFNVTAPNGQTYTLQQTDVGPAAWTGKGVDINSSAAQMMGYTPGNFPTGSGFTVSPTSAPVGGIATGPTVAEGYGTSISSTDPSTLTIDPNQGGITYPWQPGQTNYPDIGNPYGGLGSGGTATTLGQGSVEIPGQAPAGGGGGGIALNLGLQGGVTQFFSGLTTYFTNAITGLGQKMLGAAFGAVSNWFIRGMLILIGIVLIFVALRAITGSDQRPVTVAVAGGGRDIRRGATSAKASTLEAAEVAA